MQSPPKTVKAIAQDAQNLISENLSPLLHRLQQVSQTNEVQKANSGWHDSFNRLGAAVGSGMKGEIINERIAEFLLASRRLVTLASEQTDLDVSKEEEFINTALVSIEATLRDYEKYIDGRRSNQNASSPNDDKDLSFKVLLLSEQVKELQNTLDQTLSSLNAQIDPLKQQYQSVLAAYESVEPTLRARSVEIDNLLGLAGQKVLAGSYDKHAIKEQFAANVLRGFAIAVMSLAIVPIALALYDATKNALTIEQALLRLAFALVLSIPAAYLARESAKHRQEQYSLRQTALDIGAIDGYIAPLPNEMREKIKEGIAAKLFAPKSFDHVTRESYPINTQELLSKLIEMMGDLKKEVKAKRDPRKDED